MKLELGTTDRAEMPGYKLSGKFVEIMRKAEIPTAEWMYIDDNSNFAVERSARCDLGAIGSWGMARAHQYALGRRLEEALREGKITPEEVTDATEEAYLMIDDAYRKVLQNLRKCMERI